MTLRRYYEGRTSAEVLAEAYPSLFTDVRCGVSIGLGWVELVSELADAILATPTEITVEQIKEKFGGLRFYYSPYCATVENLVRIAELRAWVTCEDCGAPGERVQPRYWIRTLCEACAAEFAKK